jgi:hypothetical protein
VVLEANEQFTPAKWASVWLWAKLSVVRTGNRQRATRSPLRYCGTHVLRDRWRRDAAHHGNQATSAYVGHGNAMPVAASPIKLTSVYSTVRWIAHHVNQASMAS